MDFKEAQEIFKTLEKVNSDNSNPAYDGDYTNNENDWMWIKYNNPNELEAIMTLAFGSDYSYADIITKYPASDWVCITENEGCLSDIYDASEEKDCLSFTITTLTKCKEAVNTLFTPFKMLTPERSEILINNLLNEIVDKVWQAPATEYLPWLMQEVGFTEEEISYLKAKNCFPEPTEEREY